MFTMLVGSVDRVGKAYVATRFFSFIGPLIPQSSMLVLHESFEQHGNRSTHSYGGRPLKLVWKSVLLGYLRVWLLWFVFGWPFISMWGQRVDFSRPEFLVSGAAFLVWLAVVIFPGRLSKQEVAQLTVLGSVTGVPARPEYLDLIDFELKKDVLQTRMKDEGLPLNPGECARAVEKASPDQTALIYAFARYTKEGEWQNVMDLAWKKLAPRSNG
jgi:hypothetical protein